MIIAAIVVVLFLLKALEWELDRPRRWARWDALMEQEKRKQK